MLLEPPPTLQFDQYSAFVAAPVATTYPALETHYRKSSGPHTLTADYCHWQLGGEKFVPFKEPHTPLRALRRLGKGSIGEVEEVQCVSSSAPPGGTLACKRVTISRRRNLASRELQLIEQEISNMKRLCHPHIIQVVGSYQEGGTERPQFFCLLMSPVGDDDLAAFLDKAVETMRVQHATLSV